MSTPCRQIPPLFGSKITAIIVLLTASLLPLAPSLREPAQAQSVPVATAQNAIGALIVVRNDGIREQLQGKGALPLYEGDVLKTEAASQALIEFKEGIQVVLNENTTFKLLSRWEKGNPLTRIIRLKQGEVWVKTGPGPKPLEIETPVATAAVKSTEFDLKVQDDGQSVLTVMEGVVEFGTPFGTCPIRTNTISYGKQGKKCTKPAPTDAAAAIIWTNTVRQ
mgnify:CR=1 FL=1